jgi:hypothetical protein
MHELSVSQPDAGILAQPVPDRPMPSVPPPLGPGDGDGADRGRIEVPKPLGPGDDDGVDRGIATDVKEPPKPGEGDGAEWDAIALPPAGPGDRTAPRPILRRRRIGA